jgi:hypothetical protein
MEPIHWSSFSDVVPAEKCKVVRIGDSKHFGTEVYRTDEGNFRFVSLDRDEVTTADRCVYVEGVDAKVLDERGALSFNGLALVGTGKGDDLSWVGGGKVLWDSLEEDDG